LATQEERKQETKLKIIDNAKELFDTKGYDNTSVDDIFKLANVSKGTFYKHFKTKIDIVISIAREENSLKSKEVLTSISNGLDTLDTLKMYLNSVGDWFEARQSIAQALVVASLTQDVDNIVTDPKYSSRGFINATLTSAQKQKTIKSDIDTWELTAMIGGFIVICVVVWLQNPIKGELGKSLNKKLDILLDGIKL